MNQKMQKTTNACCEEEGKELIKVVAKGSGDVAKRYLCVLSKVTGKRYLNNQSLWEPTKEKKRDDTNSKMEKTEDHSPFVIGKGTEQTAHKGETMGKVQNPLIEYYTTPCHFKDVKEDAVYTAVYTMQTRESPNQKYKPDSLYICEDDDIMQTRENLKKEPDS
ncbi:unnamed protein product [Mytilus coruscus]|uniref:Uncharacterized protein n=1 Tax=Mytilus coruscus TaxID=42192 RepID=A0A6J8EIC7_MYTCO|nr:unnamed protein product [Mytilus coruscus]